MAQLLPADFFVLRRPLLALDEFLAVERQLAEGQSLADVLLGVYADELRREALFYASPTVHAALVAWQTGGPLPNEKLLLTLYKYFVRMTTRSTPFGLFAGIGLGQWGAMSDLRVGATVSRHLRLDAGLVSQLAHTISQLPYIRRQLSYTTNDSVWVIGDVLHYIGFNEENGQRSYYQNEVKTDACLLQLLENARQGLPYSTLSEQLKQAGVDTDTVMSYLDALIDSQLLVSDLSINLTGPDPLVRLNERLATRSGTGPLVERLTHLQALLPCCGPMSNQQIETLLHELAVSAQPPYVQCDTFLPDDTLVLSTVVQAELGHTLSDLAERSRPSVNSSLDTFKRRFFARYENQAVPLLEALDPDAGIGYDLHQEMPTPWLDSLPWHSEASSAPAETVVSEHLLKLYVSAIQQQEMVIQLTKQDLDTILPVQPNLPLPGSGYAIGQLMGQPNAPDSLFLLKGMGGPSAANLLGRFAHLSPELEARLKQCLQDEQAMYPDALLAELVHLPGARTGNVLRRPILRPHELPILTRSMVPESHQLSLRELRIAVPDGQRVVLLSHRLNQQVIPRLSTAHNVQAGGVAHYRFLYDLQQQEASLRIVWDWGPLKTMPFLPRLTYRNVVLSRAQWHLRRQDVETIPSTAWVNWQTAHRLPRYVLLAEGDNELVIDTEITVGLQLLTQALQRNGQVTLLEWPEAVTRPLAHSDQEQYWSHELLIPLRNTTPQPTLAKLLATPVSASVHDRLFAPGNRWLYLKLYVGPAAADALLAEHLPALLASLQAQNALQSWFFIRYADPEKHLRLRFLASSGQTDTVLQVISSWANARMAADSRIYRVQFDTYQRELERFGPKTIEICETWFGHDSQAIVQLLGWLIHQPDWQRLRVGCLFVHQLLTSWGYTIAEQLERIEVWRDMFLREFKADKLFQHEVNAQFRVYRPFLDKPTPSEPMLQQWLAVYGEQAAAFQQELKRADPASPNRLLPHITHLFLNRLFADSQRKHEQIIYCFLYKLLKQWQRT